MYPTDRPPDRAEKCLLPSRQRNSSATRSWAPAIRRCRSSSTAPAIQPAHFVVGPAYVERKGQPNDIQVWAVGQAVDVKRRMELLLDPKNAPKGVDIELSLFDCQACHHGVRDLQWQAARLDRAAAGPDQALRRHGGDAARRGRARRARAAKALSEHSVALHQASAAPRPDWEGVRGRTKALHGLAQGLAAAILAHDFDRADALAIAKAIVAEGDLDYSGAQQETMALKSVAAAMTALHFADDAQVNAINASLGALYTAVANDQTYRPEKFVAALRGVEASLPR